MQDLNNQKDEKGLNKDNRNFIVFLVVVILLLFGPIEPYGMIFRTAYLVILPVLIWRFLRHYGPIWNIDSLANDRLNRALISGIAGAFLVGAYLSYTAPYHAECTQYARSGECVGDYVPTKGPDKVEVLIQIVFAVLAFRYALSEKHDEE